MIDLMSLVVETKENPFCVVLSHFLQQFVHPLKGSFLLVSLLSQQLALHPPHLHLIPEGLKFYHSFYKTYQVLLV